MSNTSPRKKSLAPQQLKNSRPPQAQPSVQPPVVAKPSHNFFFTLITLGDSSTLRLNTYIKREIQNGRYSHMRVGVNTAKGLLILQLNQNTGLNLRKTDNSVKDALTNQPLVNVLKHLLKPEKGNRFAFRLANKSGLLVAEIRPELLKTLKQGWIDLKDDFTERQASQPSEDKAFAVTVSGNRSLKHHRKSGTLILSKGLQDFLFNSVYTHLEIIPDYKNNQILFQLSKSSKSSKSKYHYSFRAPNSKETVRPSIPCADLIAELRFQAGIIDDRYLLKYDKANDRFVLRFKDYSSKD